MDDVADSPAPYRVLARKYRPQTFGTLIGQDAMVRTLGNAIRRDRLAHAFLLTGVRGVGKTSTARLIAKALNCIGPDGRGGPTIDPCGVCEPCRAIAEGRNIDVLEMDAASNRGIDGVREISNVVRTGPSSERYLIYIIDEVHMMTKEAFNALLKTLEEPPNRVKFILATTEVDKVPITVLSRCQRFDLRRIPADALAAHFAHVAQEEGVVAEADALALIARAAEGSARDGLSILDQAIAHADMEGEGSGITAGQVRDMLGLSDRGAIRRLLGLVLAGDAAGALDALAEQRDLGVDPAAILKGLLETVHGVTRAKVARADDPALSAEERDALADWASRMGFATLHRLWQLLLKGHAEVVAAALPHEACEMALLRVVHASQLPDPAELARRLAGGEAVAAGPVAAPAPTHAAAAVAQAPPPAPPPPAPPPLPESPRALHDLLVAKGLQTLAMEVDTARFVRFAPPELVVARSDRHQQEGFGRALRDALKPKPGEPGPTWSVSVVEGIGRPSLRDEEAAAEAAAYDAILAHPLVAATRAAFPDAELIDPPNPRRRAL